MVQPVFRQEEGSRPSAVAPPSFGNLTDVAPGAKAPSAGMIDHDGQDARVVAPSQ
jgi:hypothetical protein